LALLVLGQGELSDESPLKAMGDAAIGIITAFHYDYTHDTAMNKAFVAAYKAEFGRNPDFLTINPIGPALTASPMRLIGPVLKACRLLLGGRSAARCS
jgi:hypothetical protein